VLCILGIQRTISFFLIEHLMYQAGIMNKMIGTLDDEGNVHYALPLSGELVPMNDFIGGAITLTHTGNQQCIACSRVVNKVFQQGYCYPCTQRLAQCDMCILKPEQCHYHLGTCREPEWGEAHCLQDHFVYLANSSALKVGITRALNIPGRWIDQGATQALPIARVKTRLLSGKVEVAAKAHMADKTNWRKMLQGAPEPIDLCAARDQLFESIDAELTGLIAEYGDGVELLEDDMPTHIHFPVNEYPVKITSRNFEKTPEIEGVLHGIKGQYLILDSGVLNIRKFGGLEVRLQS
jgi:hypothetical protein